jgi:hypothetical protein
MNATGNRGPISGASMSSTGKIPGYKTGQLSNFTPEQMELFKSLFGQLGSGSYLSRLAGGDESLFAEMEAPAMRQFSGLQGNLASRFSGMGGTGSRRSSGFQNTANQASSEFAQGLQSRRQELQRQAIGDLMGFSNQLLGQRPYENFLYEKETPWWQSLLGGILPIAGAGLGGLFGGIPGAQLGGQIGNMAGSGFRGGY